MSARRTKVEIEKFAEQIRAIVDDPPMTCRQVFYQAVALRLINKTTTGCNQVYKALRELRRAGELEWDDIVDNTRSIQQREQWASVAARLADLDTYHRDFWQGRDDRPAIWVEKDALAGVLWEVTSEYGVPLLPGRGDTSDSFIYECSQVLTDDSTVYVFTDLDGSGEGSIFTKIGEKLSEFFDCNATIERIALTPAQVKRYKLPKRPPKKGDFRNYAVELDALPKAILQQLARSCILNHVDTDAWQEHLKQEAADRERLVAIAKRESRKAK